MSSYQNDIRDTESSYLVAPFDQSTKRDTGLRMRILVTIFVVIAYAGCLAFLFSDSTTAPADSSAAVNFVAIKPVRISASTEAPSQIPTEAPNNPIPHVGKNLKTKVVGDQKKPQIPLGRLTKLIIQLLQPSAAQHMRGRKL